MTSIQVSVAAARRRFADLVQQAERGNTVEITRRGTRVAVLLSASEHAAMAARRSSFIEAARRVRRRMGVEALGIGEADLDDLREGSSGRSVPS